MAIVRDPFEDERALRRAMKQVQQAHVGRLMDEYWLKEEASVVNKAYQQPAEPNPIAPNVPRSVLDEANTIIYGDREKTYGNPSKNLDCIAQMWNSYLESVGDRPLTNKDVAVMMVLLKAARLANDPKHRDSVVDICGYAALVERCYE